MIVLFASYCAHMQPSLDAPFTIMCECRNVLLKWMDIVSKKFDELKVQTYCSYTLQHLQLNICIYNIHTPNS